MKSKVLLACAAALCLASCTENGPQMGELKAMFSSDEYSVEAGGSVSLLFAVTGVEGAELTLSAEASNSEAVIEVKNDIYYSGSVEFTAPKISDGETVNVILTVTDARNKRSAKAVTSVVVGASEGLEAAWVSDFRSIAVKAGGNASLPFTIANLNGATPQAELKLSDGWKGSVEWSGDKSSGSVELSAPASLPKTLEVALNIKDDHSRKASLELKLGVVEVSEASDAANCYIVAPGSTLTIKAVEGNSNDELDFDNAKLLWQDALGMVKSVAASSSAKVVVVELNPGISGNAVVAALKGEEIVWSWHIWVGDYDPMEDPFVYTSAETGNTYTFMDRNLGARNAIKYDAGALGLLYQWGRKDPFVGADGVESSKYVLKYDIDGVQVRERSEKRPTYPAEDYESTNLRLAIQNPLIFYTAPSSAWPVVDWLTDDAQRQDHDLWGGKSGYKTKYDPCPVGWKVPPAGDAWSFRKQYKKAGKLTDSAKYDESYPWYIDYDMSLGFRYKQADGKEYWFPLNGDKEPNEGKLSSVGGSGQIHTSSVNNTTAIIQSFAWGNPTSDPGLNRPYGSAVRCIKE